MSGLCRLKLSALKTDLTYPMNSNVPCRRCLIHVKLTDFCVRTIENLIDNEKGAFFSLYFDENGGKMSIPVDHGDSKVFQFKTVSLHDGEGLECVHQEVGSPPHSQEHSLSCWGVIEHRLTVQGTDEVYARARDQMERAEKLRKGQRTQEIQIPPSRSKAKTHSTEKVTASSVTTCMQRKLTPNRPKANTSKLVVPVISNSKPMVSSSVSSKLVLHHPQPKSVNLTAAATTVTVTAAAPTVTMTAAAATTTTSSSCTASSSTTSSSSSVSADPKASHKPGSRNIYSLKQRVIYMLAVKPQRREHIVSKLKKATKRSETAMTNLDSILEEVSEVCQGAYKLKAEYYTTIDVDQWPFYNETQKQVLKRSIMTRSYASDVNSTVGIAVNAKDTSFLPIKRPTKEAVSDQTSTKKARLAEQGPLPPPKSSSQPPPAPPTIHSTHTAPASVLGLNDHSLPPTHHVLDYLTPSPRLEHYTTSAHYLLPEASDTHEVDEFGSNAAAAAATATAAAKKHKKKKEKKEKEKRKKKFDESEVVASDPTSTSCIPDHVSQFPPLACDEERYRYKQIFNREYVDYMQFKSEVDLVLHEYQTVSSALSERLNSVPKHSDDYREVKKLIQVKYREFQGNKSYLQNKSKFDELHQKLDHIKQMVILYDSTRHRGF